MGGHVRRVKLIKRQMYGRAGFDLLRLRVLPTAWTGAAKSSRPNETILHQMYGRANSTWAQHKADSRSLHEVALAAPACNPETSNTMRLITS